MPLPSHFVMCRWKQIPIIPSRDLLGKANRVRQKESLVDGGENRSHTQAQVK